MNNAIQALVSKIGAQLDNQDMSTLSFTYTFHTLESVSNLQRVYQRDCGQDNEEDNLLSDLQGALSSWNDKVKEELQQAEKKHRKELEWNEKLSRCEAQLQEWGTFSPEELLATQGDQVEALQQYLDQGAEFTSALVRPLPHITDSWKGERFVDPDFLLDQLIGGGHVLERDMYLVTYRYFTSPASLLGKLSDRLFLIPFPAIPVEMVSTHRENAMQFLLQWIQSAFHADFAMDQANIKQFLETLARIPLWSHLHERVSTTIAQLQSQYSLQPNLWKDVTRQAEQLQSAVDLLRIRPKQFAEQLAIYEHALYTRLRREELIGQGWMKNREPSPCPNIAAYSTHYNQLHHWCVLRIYAEKTEEGRVEVIKYLLHVLVLSFQANNFLATFTLISALNSVGVYRLIKTWSLLSRPLLRLFWVFSQLTGNGGQPYKKEWANIMPPAIPYIGTALTDLVYFEDGNNTWSPQGEVNFGFKCKRVYETVQQVLRFQSTPYQFQPDEQVLGYIQYELSHVTMHSDEQLYQKSVALEQRSRGPTPHPLNQWGDCETDTSFHKDLQYYRTLHALRIFDATVDAKKSGPLDRLGASSFLQAKVSSRKKRTIDISGYHQVSHRGRTTSFATREDDNVNAWAAHMRHYDQGVPRRSQNKGKDVKEYFYVQDMLLWLEEQWNEPRAKILERAQRLVEEGFIVEVDGSIPSPGWWSQYDLKLSFRKQATLMNLNVPLCLADSVSWSYSEDPTEGSEEGEEENIPLGDSDNWSEVIARMKHPQSGLKIKNRKWMLRRFPNCFVGEQAVTWIQYQMELTDRKAAVAFGQKLLSEGYIRHVTGDHDFQDKYLFYHFIN